MQKVIQWSYKAVQVPYDKLQNDGTQFYTLKQQYIRNIVSRSDCGKIWLQTSCIVGTLPPVGDTHVAVINTPNTDITWWTKIIMGWLIYIQQSIILNIQMSNSIAKKCTHIWHEDGKLRADRIMRQAFAWMAIEGQRGTFIFYQQERNCHRDTMQMWYQRPGETDVFWDKIIMLADIW